MFYKINLLRDKQKCNYSKEAGPRSYPKKWAIPRVISGYTSKNES